MTVKMETAFDSFVSDARTFLVGPTFEDPRVEDWPLVKDWRYPTLITIGYLLMIPIGTYLMRDRKPFQLKGFSIFHNGFLFGLSLYMVIETLRASYLSFNWGTRFQPFCNPFELKGWKDEAAWPQPARDLAVVLYIHYISKAYEFVDTLIMILKKNNRQITFLHVYHHATTFFPVWFCVMKYMPGGESYFCCFLNSLVHVFMYAYYFGASLGIKIDIIKRSITSFQMCQFLLFIFQGTYILANNCSHPRLPAVFLVIQCVIFFVLFTNFFIQTYLKGGKKGAAKAAKPEAEKEKEIKAE